MKRVGIALAVGLIALLLALVWILAGQNREPESYALREAREQAKLEDLHRAAELSNFLNFFWMALLILALAGSTAFIAVLVYRALHESKLREIRAVAEASTLYPTAEGNYPARLLGNGQLLTVMPGNTRLELPQHYSPALHYSYQVKSECRETSRLPEQMLVEPDLPPGPVDLLGLLRQWQPEASNILLALGPGGKPITVAARDLCHVALAGATGGGKSNLVRLLLSQLLACNARVCLADPHYTRLDLESGEDWSAIEERLLLPPAIKAKEIGDLLNWLATEELPQRLERRRNQQSVGAPLFLAMDELPAIVAEVRNAQDQMGRILREGRKVNLLLLTSAQDWLVKTVGGTGAVRDNFRTSYYVGGDPTSARVLLDLQGRVDDGQLGKGLALLRSRVTPKATLVRVPFASNEALARLLPYREPEVEKVVLPEQSAPVEPAPQSLAEAEPNTELERAARAWKKGANSVRKLAEALQISQYRSQVLIGQLRLSYSELFDS